MESKRTGLNTVSDNSMYEGQLVVVDLAGQEQYVKFHANMLKGINILMPVYDAKQVAELAETSEYVHEGLDFKENAGRIKLRELYDRFFEYYDRVKEEENKIMETYKELVESKDSLENTLTKLCERIETEKSDGSLERLYESVNKNYLKKKLKIEEMKELYGDFESLEREAYQIIAIIPVAAKVDLLEDGDDYAPLDIGELFKNHVMSGMGKYQGFSKEVIVSKVIPSSNKISNDNYYNVYSIVKPIAQYMIKELRLKWIGIGMFGFGGVGKTTLAKMLVDKFDSSEEMKQTQFGQKFRKPLKDWFIQYEL